MTDRLYYSDSWLLGFSARVIDSSQNGERWETILDKSAFYPTSGGQSHDTGRINDIPVVDVIENSDGEILHITREKPACAGGTVQCEIDNDRRLRHCQSHTAQHIISQAFVRTCKAETVSVHLGDDYSSVELDVSDLPSGVIEKSVALANNIILAGQPVSILSVSSDEAARLPLRKIPKAQKTIRVIKVGEFDWSACGGTHCRNSAEVRFVHLAGVERLRGNLRVKFMAGETALAEFARLADVTRELSSKLTCGTGELPARITKLISEAREYRQTISRLHDEILPAKLSVLREKAVNRQGLRFVSESFSDMDVRSARRLASSLAEEIQGLAVLRIGTHLIVAVSSTMKLDASAITKEISVQTGLKGGGKKTLAQLGGVSEKSFPELCDRIIRMAADGSMG